MLPTSISEATSSSRDHDQDDLHRAGHALDLLGLLAAVVDLLDDRADRLRLAVRGGEAADRTDSRLSGSSRSTLKAGAAGSRVELVISSSLLPDLAEDRQAPRALETNSTPRRAGSRRGWSEGVSPARWRRRYRKTLRPICRGPLVLPASLAMTRDQYAQQQRGHDDRDDRGDAGGGAARSARKASARKKMTRPISCRGSSPLVVTLVADAHLLGACAPRTRWSTPRG